MLWVYKGDLITIVKGRESPARTRSPEDRPLSDRLYARSWPPDLSPWVSTEGLAQCAPHHPESRASPIAPTRSTARTLGGRQVTSRGCCGRPIASARASRLHDSIAHASTRPGLVGLAMSRRPLGRAPSQASTRCSDGKRPSVWVCF